MNVIKSHRPDYTRLYDALIYDVPGWKSWCASKRWTI